MIPVIGVRVPGLRVNPALRAALGLDIRLQRRYGFWYATAVVILLWVGVLQLLPEKLLGAAMPYVLFSDLQFMMFFIAGAVFFEKDERTLFALLTTPLRFKHYLASKLVTMTGLAVVTCVAVVLIDYGPDINPYAFIGGVLSMALLMILAGFVTAPLFPSVSEWLVPSTVVLAFVSLPIIDYSGLYQHPLFSAVPTHGTLLLFGATFDQVQPSGWQVAYAVGYPALWIGGLCLVARRVFDRYVIGREGSR